MNKCLIFDLDGVIVDTRAFHYDAWKAFFAKRGIEISYGEFLKTFGSKNEEIIPNYLDVQKEKKSLSELSCEKEQIYRELAKGKIVAAEGFRMLASQCKMHGVKMGLATSTPWANIEFVLEELSIKGIFDCIVSGEDVDRGKPDPAIFLKCADGLGASPSDCVVIEDSPQGIRAARAAGARSVAVLTTNRKEDLCEADLIVGSLAELSLARVLSLLVSAEDVLLDLDAVKYRKDKPFVLTSGVKSPVYVDCRKLISFPLQREIVIEHACAVVRDEIGLDNVEVIAGGETAGIPYAAWLAARIGLPMVYVRKTPKGFGLGQQVEGFLAPGRKVLLFEDLVFNSRSKLNFIEGIRGSGGEIENILVIFEYGLPQARESLEQAGVSLYSLASWDSVIDVGLKRGYFTEEQAQDIRAFLESSGARAS